jgi:hypothetical protein
MPFSSLLCVLHAPPLSSSLILSPKSFLVSRINYEHLVCAVFPSFSSPPPA